MKKKSNYFKKNAEKISLKLFLSSVKKTVN